MVMWTPVWVGLGSNLGDSVACFGDVLDAFFGDAAIRGLRVSSYYRTSPVGPQNQPDFLNACVTFETCYTPKELWGICRKLELEYGRKQREKWGARELDLDILIFGDLVIDDFDLSVPHPELDQRLFVLQPLMDLDPDLCVPGKGVVSHLHAICLRQEDQRVLYVNERCVKV